MTAGFPAAVTGAGLITPAGIGVDETWQSVLKAPALATKDAALEGTGAPYCLRVPEFGSDVLSGRGTANTDPFIRYALVAVGEAIRLTIHPLALIYAASGSAMISTIRVPKI
jgi:3-oxoacyl-[acyl-carrier-protein] synthase II